jgi:hypothetical protein
MPTDTENKRPITGNEDAKRFIIAGKAFFTISVPMSYRVALDDKENLACSDWYTYKISAKTDEKCWKCKGGGCRACDDTGEGQTTYFVSLLTGPDNWSNYAYMGLLDAQTGVVRLTAKSKYKSTTPPYRILNGILERIWNDREHPNGFELRHEGKCGRCGRKLTVPESIDRGIGPECWGKMAG